MDVSEESRRDSYREINKTVVCVSQEIFTIVQRSGPVTAWGVADRSDRNVYTVRPRLTELWKMGKIQKVGKAWCDRTQRNETVWDVKDKQFSLFQP